MPIVGFHHGRCDSFVSCTCTVVVRLNMCKNILRYMCLLMLLTIFDMVAFAVECVMTRIVIQLLTCLVICVLISCRRIFSTYNMYDLT